MSVCLMYTWHLYTYIHHIHVYIGMCRNHTGRLLASYSHDNRVRFWDLSMFVDDVGGEEGEEEGEGHNSDLKPSAFSTNLDEDGAMVADDEEGEEGEGAWEDMDSESDDADVEEEEESSSSDNGNDNLDAGDIDDSDSDDSDGDNNVKGNNKQGKKNSSNNKYQNATEKFYADL